MRTFESGATRDEDKDKLDYEGFLSPAALRTFAEYMHLHRVQADGGLRESDNWQKGIPPSAYMKSMWRHFMDLWAQHRVHGGRELDDSETMRMQDALCGLLFNVQGYLHEISK